MRAGRPELGESGSPRPTYSGTMRRNLVKISLLVAIGVTGLLLALALAGCGGGYGGGGGGKSQTGSTSTGGGY